MTTERISSTPMPGLPDGSMMDLARRLYPIARSLTGTGVRRSLYVLKETFADVAGLQVIELPTGQAVFDWRIPDEWNLRAAWLEGPDGERIIDLASHNLHVVDYSEPVDRTLTLEQLQPHLHSLPDRPDWIPFRSAHGQRDWGFCLSHRQRERLVPGTYRAVIDATLAGGSLTFGEVYLPGETDRDILICTHISHPSLANDNVSGMVVAAGLIRALAGRRGRFGVRVIFVPATIGAIAWLATRREEANCIAHGLVLCSLGDGAPFHYMQTYQGTAEIDRVMAHLMSAPGAYSGRVMPFSPTGGDERQFNSPGVRAPVGSLMRSPRGTYPEHQTSADDLSFISAAALQESLDLCLATVATLQANRRFLNLSPNGEPNLSRRGVQVPSQTSQSQEDQDAMLWVLTMSDRSHSLLDIANRAGMSFDRINRAARTLEKAGLLQAIN